LLLRRWPEASVYGSERATAVGGAGVRQLACGSGGGEIWPESSSEDCGAGREGSGWG